MFRVFLQCFYSSSRGLRIAIIRVVTSSNNCEPCILSVQGLCATAYLLTGAQHILGLRAGIVRVDRELFHQIIAKAQASSSGNVWFVIPLDYVLSVNSHLFRVRCMGCIRHGSGNRIIILINYGPPQQLQ